ncbi:MAG: pilus assembly protein [Chloroflexota bacterium]
MINLPKEWGQSLVEYSLILLFVVVIVIVLLSIFGPTVGNLYSNVIINF